MNAASTLFAILAIIATAPCCTTRDGSWPREVHCDGVYPMHLQGVCAGDRKDLYWCFTDVLVKTDLEGKLVRRAPVANHHGDLCFRGGKLFVAVNLGEFNQPVGRADSWVYVYDSQTLKEVARHKTPEVVHGAGGIAYHDGRFIVVGGLPADGKENYLYEYDESFAFQRRHILASGYTRLGIQTAAFADDHWWFGCYGNPQVLLKADASFALRGKWEFDCSLGIIGLGEGRFLVARGSREADKGSVGRVVSASRDTQHGLRVVEAERPAAK